MNTTITNPTTGPAAWAHHPIFRHFLWKEFRMLRGLWAAVAIMGLLVDCAERLLLPYTSDFPLMSLYTALAAAVLYAAGAAATSFSVEHEEETYDFLARLPATWWPMFAGKILTTAASAILLAGVLSIAAWMFPGARGLDGQAVSAAIGMLGFAIVEAIAWGTFFSLLIRRPLLAAILTLVVGILAVHLAVNISAANNAVASLSPESYAHAIPMRLAIVVALFAASIGLAHRWLAFGPGHSSLPPSGIRNSLARFLTAAFPRFRHTDMVAARGSRRRMLSRLLWQTWRENWKLLPFPMATGVFLTVALGAAVGLASAESNLASYVVGYTLLFIPALCGAMVFYADQRRASVRFLAEHAAAPRYIWFARNSLWLGSLVSFWVVMTICFTVWVLVRMRGNEGEFIDNYFVWGRNQLPTAPYLVYEASNTLSTILQIAGRAAFGALLAYSIGQFCSMAMRSEILAAFISLLLSVLVVAWASIAYAWQLSSWLFLLPLIVGFLLATWLRAPDWVAGRNSLRRWTKPAIAVMAPILMAGLYLPSARLAQLPPTFQTYSRHPLIVAEAVADKLRSFESGNSPEARATAEMYVKAAERLAAGVVLPDLLEPWQKPEYLDDSPDVPPGGGQIDPKKIPPDQLPKFLAARKKYDKMFLDAQRTMIDLAIAASKRPTCRFEFPVQPPAPTSTNGKVRTPSLIGHRHSTLLYTQPLYFKLDRLLDSVADDDVFDRMLAALRMSAHLRSGQSSDIFIDQLEKEQEILRSISNWANQKKRTKEELQQAINDLNNQFQSSPNLESPLLADHLLVRDVILGKELPLIISQSPIPAEAHLAYAANQLPWERQRALKALERITLRNTREAAAFEKQLNSSRPRQMGITNLFRWLRPRYGSLPQVWEIEEPAATTSYLTLLEYKAHLTFSELCRAYCDNQVCRRATLLQIGLAMYRLDHKEYPQRQADLTPQYLAQLPLDPYSGQLFAYEPAGLNFPFDWRNERYSTYYSQKIEPYTAFFWSVGAGNARLMQGEYSWYESPDEGQPDTIPQQKSASQYEFQSPDSWAWGDSVFVFVLPK